LVCSYQVWSGALGGAFVARGLVVPYFLGETALTGMNFAVRVSDDFEFAERLEELNEELESLNAEGRKLEERIADNIAVFFSGVTH